ncbi:DUF2491 family protein [Escherichia coli]|nr:DUF2491 family protein [Escherichia coli]EFG8127634.1 DUF2491 family protein [Escherichia coli]EKQ5566443.1 DUF2491 family protein [Escherichia coli]
MSGFFQRLFGKDNKPAIARGPLGLHLNSGFTLDTLAFRLLEDELLIALPGEEFTVAAVSHIDLGGGSQIFRYYTSGDEFLQINTTGGEDIDDIDDIKLFVYEESYGISKESHWREAINAKAMGAMTLNWQEKRWQRFFNSEEPGNIEPVYMLEKVENQNHAKWEVHNFSAYFFIGVAMVIIFLFIYSKITPHNEWQLIKNNNTAASLAFSGTLLGYVIPLSSATINAVSIPDYFAWGGIALVIQLLVFAGVRLYMPALSEKIINHNTAAGMFMGTAALAGGIFNAACMTW